MLAKTTYVPGVCNIGIAERHSRARAGWVALAVTIAAWAGMEIGNLAPAWRLLLFFPAAAAAISLLQSVLKFCVGFGMRGLFNFGALGEEAATTEDWARRRDRNRSWQLISYATGIGAATALFATGMAALLP